jgi:small-conductance mechanosensitive channel/CRP-like cAMP-binding protein
VPAFVLSLALFAAALTLRVVSINRHVRGRLLASAVLFSLSAVATGLIRFAQLPADIAGQISLWTPLLIALGLVNAAVSLVLNPWRSDRPPDRFPTIVQDAIVIALFAIAATLILRERILATTAVGAVVVGFALQDTLGNLFAGLAIQVEKPFRLGHWVTAGGVDGRVIEITWRATKIRTKAGNVVVVPNSVLARDIITNYSEPSAATRIELMVGTSYDDAPNDVRDAILEAIRDEPLLAPDQPPDVLVDDFAAYSINYRVRIWITDFGLDQLVRDRVRTRMYYIFRRRGISIPFPIQVYMRKEAPPPVFGDEQTLQALRGVEIFESLGDEEQAALVLAARRETYAAGEPIVRQGEPGASMFVVVRGNAVVTVDGAAGPLAELGTGAVFGEMSLLTGEPRVATVAAAAGDCDLLEITVEAFRSVVLANPAVVDRISTAVATRRAELDAHRATIPGRPEPEPPSSFAARVRRYLRLSAS